jgi:fumarate reductase subunit C
MGHALPADVHPLPTVPTAAHSVRFVESSAGRSRDVWPARLDLAQSGTGLALGVFMWAHMLFVASILLGKDAMWVVARFFEGYFFFGTSHPGIVTVLVGAVIVLFVAHAALALRKFPSSVRAYRAFRAHESAMRHADTRLWHWQVATGFALFFLASVHLYTMLTHPEAIGPYASADRVWSGRLWPLYLLLLFVVEIHGGIGLYRVAVKWSWLGSAAPDRRRRLRRLKTRLTVSFLLLGLLTLAAYMRIGFEHRERAGERYVPSFLAAPPGHAS